MSLISVHYPACISSWNHTVPLRFLPLFLIANHVTCNMSQMTLAFLLFHFGFWLYSLSSPDFSFSGYRNFFTIAVVKRTTLFGLFWNTPHFYPLCYSFSKKILQFCLFRKLELLIFFRLLQVFGRNAEGSKLIFGHWSRNLKYICMII